MTPQQLVGLGIRLLAVSIAIHNMEFMLLTLPRTFQWAERSGMDRAG